ncbi:MAG: periplasmic heavy metal sensor [Aquisalimonadaceae bacterium]
MKKTLLLSSLILGLSLSAAGIALAHGDGHRGKGWSDERSGHMDRMAEKLELTDDQREQIRAAMQAHGPELRELRKEIREQRKALMNQGTDGFNEETARANADTLGELTGQAAFLSARMRADMQAVLTDEQRQKMTARMEQRRGHGGGHHRHGGGMRGDRSEK